MDEHTDDDVCCPIVGVVNPLSGSGTGSATWAAIAGTLAAAGRLVETVTPTGADAVTSVANDHAARGAVVVAVGGDGTVRAVAEGVVRAGGVMGIVPSGRGNDLAGRLGLPKAAPDIAAALLSGRTRTIDVIDANGTIVPGNVYAGLDGVASEIANASRWIPRRFVYDVAPLLAVGKWRPATVTIHPDDTTPQMLRVHSIVVANSGRYGNGLAIVPDASLDDGVLDVLTIDARFIGRIATFLPQLKRGAHIDRSDVTVRPARRIRIESDRPLALWADGERIGALPVTVTVLHAALRVVS